MTDNMFEIDVDNNNNTTNELLGNQSSFLNPEVVDILQMFRDKKQKLFTYVHTGDYDAKEAILAQMTEDVHPEAQILKRKLYSELV
jgi:hypothetical protein